MDQFIEIWPSMCLSFYLSIFTYKYYVHVLTSYIYNLYFRDFFSFPNLPGMCIRLFRISVLGDVSIIVSRKQRLIIDIVMYICECDILFYK